MVGAFVTGLVAAVIVLAAALLSLPYWPQEARTLWRGPAVAARAAPPAAPPPARRRPPRSSTPPPSTPPSASSRARLDDLDKRVRAAASTAAQAAAPGRHPG